MNTIPSALLAIILCVGPAVAQEQPLPKGLVSYWNFDGSTADQAWLYTADVGAAEDNLRQRGGPVRYVPGVVGRAVRLDRSHLSAPFSADVPLGATYTIEAWIKPAAIEGVWQRLVLHWGGEKGYHLAIHNAQVSLYHAQADGLEPHPEGGVVVVGRWQHLAAVANAETKRLAVFLDGRLVAETPYDGTVHPTTFEPLGIGNSAGGPGDDARYVGDIDELAIWNVPLTDETILAHYERPGERFGLTLRTFRPTVMDDGPLGYWTLDETQDATAVADASGAGLQGVLQGETQLGQPPVASPPNVVDNRAAVFDGLNDTIAIGDVDAIDAAQSLSVEAWIRWVEPPGGIPSVAAVLRKEAVFAFGAGWLGEGGASRAHRNARFWIHTDDGGWLHSDNGTTEVDDGRPHHLVGVYDGRFLRIYVDGVEESSRQVGQVTLSSNKNGLFLGSNNGQSEFFPGAIDEAAVYTRALSAVEVYEHYVFGAAE